jgi:hypothetical protein
MPEGMKIRGCGGPAYTVKKANGNQRCDRNFPLPILENPI